MHKARNFFIPVTTGVIVILNVLVFLWELSAFNMGLASFILDDYAFHWTAFLSRPLANLPALFSSLFFHADSFHIKSNLIFFILFASSVEKAVGHWRFLLLYLMWGAVASVTQGIFEPFTGGLIGASGAISGSAGAFFVLHPLKMPFRFLHFGAGRYVSWIPAFLLVGLWYAAEVYHGVAVLSPESGLTGMTDVAHWAHIGGFTAGAISMIPFLKKPR